jgi:hypothetical protein
VAGNEKLFAAAAGGVGALFLWSALRNKSVLSAAQKTIQGKSATTAASLPETGPSSPIQSAAAAAYTGTAPVPTSGSEKAWITAVLIGIGAPTTSANINSLVAWGQHESVWPGGPGKGGTYNLFNTTLSMPGATNYNSVGVKNYPTSVEGVAATVATLLESHYNDITSALRGGRGLCGQSFAGLSTWSGGGYSSVC